MLSNTSLSPLQIDLLLSAILALIMGLGGYAGAWLVSRNKDAEAQRFWHLTFRHLAAAAVFIGLFVIWWHYLQAILLALGAAAVGFLVGFREAWMSLLAFWLRVAKRHYGLGDFIEIDGVRGRVVDITWQTTVLAETGRESLAYSGRVVQVPNNRFLTSPLLVENMTGKFSAHTFTVFLNRGVDVLAAERVLLEAAEEHCAAFATAAREHMESLRSGHTLDTPSVDPRTTLRFEKEGYMAIVVRIVVPSRDKLRLEQTILHSFLARSREWERRAEA